jgi:hypothetical protein
MAECAEGRAGYVDSQEIFFGPDYPTTVTDLVFTLENAKNNLFAVQYIDVAGNVLSKSFKGTLQRAIVVDVLNTSISVINTDLRVFVEDLIDLNNVLVTTRVCQGECDAAGEPVEELFEIADPALAGIIEVDEVANVITFLDFDTGQLSEDFVTIEVIVRATGAFGRDLVAISPCLDAADDIAEANLQDANFVSCGFRAQGTRVFIDLVVNGEISDDFQYRARLEGFSGQIKLNDGFKITGPGGSQPSFTKSGNVLTLSFDAARVGWDGVSPVTVHADTQAGVKGKQETGFIDEMIFTGEP